MSAPKQWDISKAVVISSFFNFFHNVGNFCVFPFLTIFFRHLGLSPPLVGIIMGVKHIVFALWAPFCSLAAKTKHKRRIVITSSLLLSAVAGAVLTVYPPLPQDVVFRFCNASLPGTNGPTTPSAMDFEMFAPDDNGTFTLPEPPLMTTLTSTRFTIPNGKTLIENSTLETKSTHEALRNVDATTSHVYTAHLVNTTHSDSSITLQNSSTDKLEDRTTTSDLSTINLEPRTSSSSLALTPPIDPNSSALSSPPQAKSSNLFEPKKRDLSKTPSQTSYFFDVKIKIFLVVLGIVVFWEICASPLEWTSDDSLYEYLDFVDATDRHERVWIWRYLGASLGSCFIVILIDHLKCFLVPPIPKIYLHFYGYTAFTVITLLLSTLYPIYAPKNTEHTSKTIKALGLVGSDGRIVLLAITLFLMGAVRSTAENFLFWQMQDIGSSELYMGLSVTVALLSEIALYTFKNKLMRSLSFKWMVVLALLCQAAQLLYYSFLWAPWAALPIQLLSSFSNGALLWAVKSQVDDAATQGTERSIQLILNCLSHHLGASLGSFAGGFVMSSFGLPVLYWACCVILLVWLLMFLMIQPKLPHIKKINYSRLLAPDNSDMSDSEDEQERDWLVKAMKDDSKIW